MKNILLRYLSYLKRISYYFIYFPLAFVYVLFTKKTKKNEEIWLICERGYEARDNGYHLFKYIRTNYPEINVYFAITNDSVDIDKIKSLGNLIEYNSLEHFIFFIMSRKLISTHMYGAAPYGKASLPFLKILPTKKLIHLKHGVSYNKTNLNLKDYDLVTCSSQLELKILQKNIKNDISKVKILGLCRYDNLIDMSNSEEKKIILIMPTFRRWLEDASRLSNKDIIFKKDPYYIAWNSLINNKELLQLCEKENLRIVFYPHYRIHKYLKNFIISSDKITVANSCNHGIQELLRKSSIMITDYSSVFFDFAYMRKPIVHYQFDDVKYRKEHYQEGEFNLRNNGFGPIYDSEQDIIKSIKSSIKNEYLLEDKYLERINNFFEYSDTNNTKRNFEETFKL